MEISSIPPCFLALFLHPYVFLGTCLMIAILLLRKLTKNSTKQVEKSDPVRFAMKLGYICFGHAFVLLGILGALLPLLPSTPFLLLAAFCYSKGSIQFHEWLINHPSLGPKIKDYREFGVIPLKAKQISTLCILINLSIPLFLTKMHLHSKVFATLASTTMILFLWSKPSKKPDIQILRLNDSPTIVTGAEHSQGNPTNSYLLRRRRKPPVSKE
mmetsp:Transcript_10852/g.14108  ORF Transcript_10852/g.14108 Transcript_10852/m.14108 type:complete len:214 (+) Transcript_10852:134-775(+)